MIIITANIIDISSGDIGNGGAPMVTSKDAEPVCPVFGFVNVTVIIHVPAGVALLIGFINGKYELW